jgi:hypothetical protein
MAFDQVDSLLEHPRIDAEIKVYRGGGMVEPTKYHGVTGEVQRHQVSLYEIPKQKRELKVYRGGGEEEITFRGKGIREFMENKAFYESLKATGKHYLPEVTEGQGQDSLQTALNDLHVFFYGEKGTFNFAFKSQLLLFSTVLASTTPKARDSPSTLGLLVLKVTGDTWTLRAEEAEVEAEVVAEVEVAVAEAEATVFIPPYWVRDPTTLTYTSFFTGLTKSEFLYMNDIIFKGYPYKFLTVVFTDDTYKIGDKSNQEEFFELVWKPLIEHNVNDPFIFQQLSELRDGRKFLNNLLDAQRKKLAKDLDDYLGHRPTVEEGEDKDQEDQEEEDQEEEDYDVKEDEGDEEEDAKDEVIERKVKGEKDEDYEEDEEQNEEKEGEEEEDETVCKDLLNSTDTNVYIKFIKKIYTETHHIDWETFYDKDNVGILKDTLENITLPTMRINNPIIKENLKKLNDKKNSLIDSLNTLYKVRKTQHHTDPYVKKQNDSHSLVDEINGEICNLYEQLNKLSPPTQRGGRKTRKLSKSSHTVKSKHDK